MNAIYVIITILALCLKVNSQTEINYTFDKTGNLVSEEYGSIYLLEYKYDIEGNLISKFIKGDTSSVGESLLEGDIFKAFPNPVENTLTINAPANDIFFKIYLSNLSGIILYTTETKAPFINIDMQNYPQGFYFVKLETKSKVQVFNIIKDK